MGQMKELWMEQMQRGHSQWPGKRYLCRQCVTDAFLMDKLDESSEDEACSYCGAMPSADLVVLLDEIADYLATEYEDPANSMIYESKEGGYPIEPDNGADLVRELDRWSDREDVVEDAAVAFSDSFLCQRDYWRSTDDEMLRYGWERFRNLVKHRTRYLFFDTMSEETPWDEAIPPNRVLSALGRLVNELNVFSVIPKDNVICRVREHPESESPCTAEDLGPPPREKTCMNRMSPAGIPMFYGAYDPKTAIRETFGSQCGEGRAGTLARFRVNRDLFVLDLTRLPPFPSPFDRAGRHLRRPLRFLHEFVSEFSRPIKRDGGEVVDYVPTQVVTEFFRYRHRGDEDRPIDGIAYRSSRKGGGHAVVLFFTGEECGPWETERGWGPEEVLSLTCKKRLEPRDLVAAVEAGS